MKKYNLKEIMKKAWSIKKEHSLNEFSLCLKMAWALAKENPTLTGVEALVISEILFKKGITELQAVNTTSQFKMIKCEKSLLNPEDEYSPNVYTLTFAKNEIVTAYEDEDYNVSAKSDNELLNNYVIKFFDVITNYEDKKEVDKFYKVTNNITLSTINKIKREHFYGGGLTKQIDLTNQFYINQGLVSEEIFGNLDVISEKAIEFLINHIFAEDKKKGFKNSTKSMFGNRAKCRFVKESIINNVVLV